MSRELLRATGLSVELVAKTGVVEPIVRDLSFTIHPGEGLGIVGESGSGKSVTLQAVRRMLAEQFRIHGDVSFEGRDVYAMTSAELRAWHRSEIGMIYQDPRAVMNPVRRIGDFLTETIRSRYSKAEAAELATRQLRKVGIVDPDRRLGQYPHELSGGLLQRVMIASALLEEPRLLLADEPTTALDVTTQEEVMAILGELRREHGMACILVTHDLDLAAAVSDRVATFYAGSLVEIGPSTHLHRSAIHPYTRALLDSRPAVDQRVELVPIPGRPASAAEAGVGCAFAPRCPMRVDVCDTVAPVLASMGPREVSCHRAQDSAREVSAGDGG